MEVSKSLLYIIYPLSLKYFFGLVLALNFYDAFLKRLMWSKRIYIHQRMVYILVLFLVGEYTSLLLAGSFHPQDWRSSWFLFYFIFLFLRIWILCSKPSYLRPNRQRWVSNIRRGCSSELNSKRFYEMYF